jgi:hypothetical protein
VSLNSELLLLEKVLKINFIFYNILKVFVTICDQFSTSTYTFLHINLHKVYISNIIHIHKYDYTQTHVYFLSSSSNLLTKLLRDSVFLSCFLLPDPCELKNMCVCVCVCV